MLSLKTGGILDTDARAIVVPVNAVGVLGAGLAKAAATRWPSWAKLYKQACYDSDLEQAGDVTLHRNPDPGPEWIISVATKGHWSENSNIPAIVTTLKTLAKMVRDHRFESLALPALGCGLGRLPWNDVYGLIQEYLGLSPCDIHVYTPPLCVIIAGSRGITSYKEVVTAIQESGFTIRQVISGGARGVDQLGERWAREHKLSVAVMPANWEKDGKAAGYIRNEKMAEVADALVTVWDGKSKGTKHMIDAARKRGLTVHVHNVTLSGE